MYFISSCFLCFRKTHSFDEKKIGLYREENVAQSKYMLCTITDVFFDIDSIMTIFMSMCTKKKFLFVCDHHILMTAYRISNACGRIVLSPIIQTQQKQLTFLGIFSKNIYTRTVYIIRQTYKLKYVMCEGKNEMHKKTDLARCRDLANALKSFARKYAACSQKTNVFLSHILMPTIKHCVSDYALCPTLTILYTMKSWCDFASPHSTTKQIIDQFAP